MMRGLKGCMLGGKRDYTRHADMQTVRSYDDVVRGITIVRGMQKGKYSQKRYMHYNEIEPSLQVLGLFRTMGLVL
jgi:hypothetical protein